MIRKQKDLKTNTPENNLENNHDTNDSNNEYTPRTKSSKKKTIINIIIGIAILIIFLLVWQMLYGGYGKKVANNHPNISFETDNTNNPKDDKNNPRKGIDLIVFENVTINSKNPNIRIGNPPNNDVYMKYTIKDSNTGKIYFQSKIMKPGVKKDINFKTILKNGKYKVHMIVECYDKKTMQQYNGSNQEITITVK